jgi:hypothetical protein
MPPRSSDFMLFIASRGAAGETGYVALDVGSMWPLR